MQIIKVCSTPNYWTLRAMFVPINVADVKQNERRFFNVLGRYEHASCRFYYRSDGGCSGQSRNCMRVF